MSLSRYNRIYNFSLAVIILYSIVCLADIVLSLGIAGVIKSTAVFYLIFAFGMLFYKIHLTRRFFLGKDVIYNLIAHGIFTVISVVLIIVSIL